MAKKAPQFDLLVLDPKESASFNLEQAIMNIEARLNKMDRDIQSLHMTKSMDSAVLRKTSEHVEDNFKRLNIMLLEFKGMVGMSRAGLAVMPRVSGQRRIKELE